MAVCYIKMMRFHFMNGQHKFVPVTADFIMSPKVKHV